MSHLFKCHVSLATPHGYNACVHLLRCHVASTWSSLDTSKNVKSRLSWNPTKFDRVTRFRETNSTVKSVSSSKI